MNNINVKKRISDTNTLYGHIENDSVVVTGQSWHSYEGATGYETIDNPYYDEVNGWVEDITEPVTPL